MGAVKTWRAPTAEEFPHGMAELGKIIGEAESVRPTWTRRLVLSEPGGQWCLLVDEAAQPTLSTLAPWADEIQLRSFPTAYPLAEGVQILQGPNNPEAILADRRARVKAHYAEIEAEKAAAAAKIEAERVEAERLDAERAQFKGGLWARLDGWQQFAYSLALRVAERDPALAADLRSVAAEAKNRHPAKPALDFPRCDWWTS